MTSIHETIAVLGASENETRYSNMAVKNLREEGYKVLAFGAKQGRIGDVGIQTGHVLPEPLHTVTLYLSAANQDSWIEPILNSGVKRVIFNPGTENAAFQLRLEKRGIEAIEACTLVMLRTHQF